MKTCLLGIFAFVLTLGVSAQVKTPQPSPFSKVDQIVGLTNVSLEYSRPNVRERAVFGNLVPYGELWRTGANNNTKITFSDPVVIDGKNLAAGTYAIYSIPNKTSWDVIFYKDVENWGLPQTWDDSKVAVKTTVEVYPLPMNIETLTMTFDDLTNDSAVLGILWEKVYVGVKFEVPTDALVTKTITETMVGTPTSSDYYSSAVYYMQSGNDINQAQIWIDKSIEMSENPQFWQYRQQALIHAKAGDKKGAIEASKKSLEGAKAAGNKDYVKMNTDSLKEWGAM
ncbi:DUF2911 domain-containing protein [Formosa sp. A9]|uniref:DUF2911 domain-containing protein n=1 Tax=Formosa sp. A9 TaxID=3442641 RepID=UPI003EB6FA3B